MVFSGCSKEINDPVAIEGNFSGEMSYSFNGNLVVFRVNRSIRGDSSTWYTSPPIVSDFNPSGAIYPIVYRIDEPGVCNGKSYNHLWVYSGSGTIVNDSLFESGTYDYKYIRDGIQVLQVTGTWKAKFGKTVIWRPL
jgi:hypothetical protein